MEGAVPGRAFSEPLRPAVPQERYTCPSLALHPREPVFLAQTNGNYLALFSAVWPYRMSRRRRYEGHKVPIQCPRVDTEPWLRSRPRQGREWVWGPLSEWLPVSLLGTAGHVSCCVLRATCVQLLGRRTLGCSHRRAMGGAGAGQSAQGHFHPFLPKASSAGTGTGDWGCCRLLLDLRQGLCLCRAPRGLCPGALRTR